MNKIYACIDLKSFYASVECVERNLNPLNTNLVVADYTRTEKTICLAITPSLKQYGLGGRARLYEVLEKVKEINNTRRKENNYHKFTSKSFIDSELKQDKSKKLAFIIAKPHMKKYMTYSTNIYKIYLKYLSKDDIYVYSIDEIFCDLTPYLKIYNLSPKELISKMIKDVYDTTGITATAGIGTNLYLAKIAMDIEAKHMEPNEYGVRIAYLDEMSYRKKLWNHTPLTSFWRVGPGISKKLNEHNMYTMGDVAKCSLENENLLYDLFGVNAEVLIDHAWGYEPVTIKDIKSYKPESQSISEGQVLHEPYNYEKTILILKEMLDNLSLELVSKNMIASELVITIIYDVSNLKNKKLNYQGPVVLDNYGRKMPKYAHGTIRLDYKTSSSRIIINEGIELFNKIIDPRLLVRKIYVVASNIKDDTNINTINKKEQLNLFTYESTNTNNIKELEDNKNDINLEKTILTIKDKYGKNSIVKAMDLSSGATRIERNKSVGGHNE